MAADDLADRIAALETMTAREAPRVADGAGRQEYAAGLAVVAAEIAAGQGQHEDASALRKEAAARMEIAGGSSPSGGEPAPEGGPDPTPPVADFKRDAEAAAQSYGFGKTATLIYSRQEAPMNEAAETPAVSEVVKEAAHRREIGAYMELHDTGTVTRTGPSHRPVAIETDYEKGPVRPGHPMGAPATDQPDRTEPSPAAPQAHPIVFEEGRPSVAPGGNDYSPLREQNPAPQPEGVEAAHPVPPEVARTAAIMEDTEPTGDKQWAKASDEAWQAESARRQAAEKPGDGMESRESAAQPMSYSERLAARYAALEAESKGLEQDHGNENDTGRSETAVAFRSFGSR